MTKITFAPPMRRMRHNVIVTVHQINGYKILVVSMTRYLTTLFCKKHSNEFGDFVVVDFFNGFSNTFADFVFNLCDFKDFFY
jgi:hypothetical protein